MANRIDKGSVGSMKKWLYILLGIVIMMSLGTVYSWSIFRIPIEEKFGIGTTQSGFPYMVSLASYAIFMLISGRYLDRFSPRAIIIVGGLLVGLGWTLSGFAENIYQLTATYGLITGAGVGIVYGVPMAVAAKWFPEKRGLVVGLVLGGFGLSPFITAPIARYLIEEFGIMNSFQILGISFGILIPLLSWPFEYPSAHPGNGRAASIGELSHGIDTKNMLRTRSFKNMYLCFMIGAMIGLIMIGMTSSVGIELIGIDPGSVALFTSLFAVFNGVGRPLFGLVADRFQVKNAMALSYGLIIVAASLMLMAKDESTVLYAVAFSLFWLNLGGWLSIAPTATTRLYGVKHYSQNYGVVFTAYGIAAVVGVLASGFLKDAMGNYNSIFYMVIILAFMGMFLSRKVEMEIQEKQMPGKKGDKDPRSVA